VVCPAVLLKLTRRNAAGDLSGAFATLAQTISPKLKISLGVFVQTPPTTSKVSMVSAAGDACGVNTVLNNFEAVNFELGTFPNMLGVLVKPLAGTLGL
jgi:hypothetical protein